MWKPIEMVLVCIWKQLKLACKYLKKKTNLIRLDWWKLGDLFFCWRERRLKSIHNDKLQEWPMEIQRTRCVWFRTTDGNWVAFMEMVPRNGNNGWCVSLIIVNYVHWRSRARLIHWGIVRSELMSLHGFIPKKGASVIWRRNMLISHPWSWFLGYVGA